MNTTAFGAARERRKADRTMETNADGTYFLEGITYVSSAHAR